MKTKAGKPIASLAELREQLPSILEEYSGDENLTRAALVNPILALEKAGFEFSQEARREVEMLIRIGEKEAHKLTLLRSFIYESSGFEFDIEDEASLRQAVQKLVEVTPPALAKKMPASSKAASNQAENVDELLKTMQEHHPALRLIRDYRTLMRKAPVLADKEQFEAVFAKRSAFPVKLKKVRFLLRNKTSG